MTDPVLHPLYVSPESHAAEWDTSKTSKTYQPALTLTSVQLRGTFVLAHLFHFQNMNILQWLTLGATDISWYFFYLSSTVSYIAEITLSALYLSKSYKDFVVLCALQTKKYKNGGWCAHTKNACIFGPQVFDIVCPNQYPLNWKQHFRYYELVIRIVTLWLRSIRYSFSHFVSSKRMKLDRFLHF